MTRARCAAVPSLDSARHESGAIVPDRGGIRADAFRPSSPPKVDQDENAPRIVGGISERIMIQPSR